MILLGILLITVAIIGIVGHNFYIKNKNGIRAEKLIRVITGKGITKEKNIEDREKEVLNKIFFLFFSIGAGCGIILLWGSENMISDSILIGALTAFISLFYTRMARSVARVKKRGEVIQLFLSVDNMMDSGKSFEKSLRESGDMLVYLKPAIKKSVAYFPDTKLVLNKLREEINLPEADVLVSLLQQLNVSGTDRFYGIIQKEVKILEDVGAASEKIKIKNRSQILIIPRILSLIIVVLMILGSLSMKIEGAFKSIGL